MLPSEVRGRSGSHSGSMMSSAMTRVLAVAIKPRSRAASQSRSRVESSICVDADVNNKDVSSRIITHPTPRTQDVTPESTYNPYSSNKDSVGTSANAALHSVRGSQRKDSQRLNPAAGGGSQVAKSALASITSGDHSNNDD